MAAAAAVAVVAAVAVATVAAVDALAPVAPVAPVAIVVRNIACWSSEPLFMTLVPLCPYQAARQPANSSPPDK